MYFFDVCYLMRVNADCLSCPIKTIELYKEKARL